MRTLTPRQKDKLADFLNNLAVAWFTSGIIVPTFTDMIFPAKVIYFFMGLVFTCGFLYFSLNLAKDV